MAETSKKSGSVNVGGIPVYPGERACIDLPVADLYTHAQLTMPVQVINGKKPGPTLFITAAIHGDELNGVEIVRRLLALKALDSLRGCLLAVPIVNVHGFLDQSRYLPDRRDLNRSFPGSAKGSVAARIAHIISEQIISQSDFGLDLHTGALHRSNLPQIRANLDDPATLELAEVFGVPILINAPVRDGSLRGYATEQGVPTLLYEVGEALRFDEVGIRAGIRGIRNVMRQLGMLPSKRELVPKESAIATSSAWVRAPESGIVRFHVKLGERVKQGQRLAEISDPFGEVMEGIYARFAGIVIGRTNLPLAHEGDALIHIARFDKVAEAGEIVSDFHDDLSQPARQIG